MVTMKVSEKVRPTYNLMTDLIKKMRSPRVRTMREFAEQEIIVPNGPYEGHRFKADLR